MNASVTRMKLSKYMKAILSRFESPSESHRKRSASLSASTAIHASSKSLSPSVSMAVHASSISSGSKSNSSSATAPIVFFDLVPLFLPFLGEYLETFFSFFSSSSLSLVSGQLRAI